MGKINPDNIDKLFFSLKDQSIDADLAQLDNFEILLEKKRFYFFGWMHFNIYYLLIIVLHSLITIGLLVTYLFNNTTREIPSITYIQKDSSTTDAHEKTVIIEHTEEHSKNLYTDTLKDKIEKSRVTIEAKNSEGKKAIIDSSLFKKVLVIAGEVENKDTVQPATTAPAPSKRIIYVKKRDTIIQVDTTKKVRKK